MLGDVGIHLSRICSDAHMMEVFDYVAGDFSRMKKRSCGQIQKCKAQKLFNENRAKIRILFFIFYVSIIFSQQSSLVNYY